MVPASHRSSSATHSGLANPLFQEGGRARPGRRQLSLGDIGQPSLLSSTAAPRAARAHSPVLAPRPSVPGPRGPPLSPPRRPPQVTTHPSQWPQPHPCRARPCGGTGCWLGDPSSAPARSGSPLGAQVRQSGLSSRQEKPKPPSKPLPALKGKAPSYGEGPPAPSLPPTPFQRCPPPKVALKPPPARR